MWVTNPSDKPNPWTSDAVPVIPVPKEELEKINEDSVPKVFPDVWEGKSFCDCRTTATRKTPVEWHSAEKDGEWYYTANAVYQCNSCGYASVRHYRSCTSGTVDRDQFPLETLKPGHEALDRYYQTQK